MTDVIGGTLHRPIATVESFDVLGSPITPLRHVLRPSRASPTLLWLRWLLTGMVKNLVLDIDAYP
jgi:hypothetical protein